MTVNLMFSNDNAQLDAAANWAALTAISASDANSPYPTEAYVAVSNDVIVWLASHLDGALLANGETVTTYDFSVADDDWTRVEAHINAFGPSLLNDTQRDRVREQLAAFPAAVAMFDEIVARGLQLQLSTDLLNGQQSPHLKGVNWAADEVEINRCSGNMIAMLEDLGLGAIMPQGTDLPFDRFAKAVNDKRHATDMADRLRAFVACARRQGATSVYWG